MLQVFSLLITFSDGIELIVDVIITPSIRTAGREYKNCVENEEGPVSFPGGAIESPGLQEERIEVDCRIK
jgi:hypothetical protein